jgi:hypothetical protein
MNKHLIAALVAALLITCFFGKLRADDPQKTLLVTMTNDPGQNELIVLDAATHARLQTISTNGKGGVTMNARGVKQYNGRLFAAVNNGSGTVALFTRAGDHLVFEQLVSTTSPPVSIDFANGHMYVAGASSVDSFIVYGNHVGALDGTTQLVLSGGGIPTSGSTAQVGATDANTLLVTLKTDPTPGTVDVIRLADGAISGTAMAVSAPTAPTRTLTPFGFSVYPDGTALITLAHSGHDGLFRNGAFDTIVNSGGQAGNCWTTRIGKYVLIVNTGSMTISRAVGTGSNIFIDNPVAARITTGGSPTDIDAAEGYMAVIDHSSGSGATSHVTVLTYNAFAELSAIGSPVDLGVPNANGMAVMPPVENED